MKRGIALLEIGTWITAAAVLAATFFWAPLHLRAADRDTRAVAETALDQLVAGERAALNSLGHYVAFGPSPQERQAAFPQLQLDPRTTAFQFDAIALDDHSIRLRATTTAQGVTDGTVTPLSIARDLTAPHPANDAPNPTPGPTP
jgi:hypothetical protein